MKLIESLVHEPVATSLAAVGAVRGAYRILWAEADAQSSCSHYTVLCGLGALAVGADLVIRSYFEEG